MGEIVGVAASVVGVTVASVSGVGGAASGLQTTPEKCLRAGHLGARAAQQHGARHLVCRWRHSHLHVRELLQ